MLLVIIKFGRWSLILEVILPLTQSFSMLLEKMLSTRDRVCLLINLVG